MLIGRMNRQRVYRRQHLRIDWLELNRSVVKNFLLFQNSVKNGSFTSRACIIRRWTAPALQSQRSALEIGAGDHAPFLARVAKNREKILEFTAVIFRFVRFLGMKGSGAYVPTTTFRVDRPVLMTYSCLEQLTQMKIYAKNRKNKICNIGRIKCAAYVWLRYQAMGG